MAKYLINEIVKKAMILGTVRNLRKNIYEDLTDWELQTVNFDHYQDEQKC